LSDAEVNDADCLAANWRSIGMRVAFIGLGNMGLGMAHNLLKAGMATTVFDVRAEPVQSVVSAGA
jgi:UDP-N-acetyl-D-mannosaminuronate dehydrogenase